MTELPNTNNELLGDRAWAGELFITADALLSGMKQLHVEGEEDFLLLALEGGSERLECLEKEPFEATCRLSRLIIEEAVDGIGFFALVWASLSGGGPIVASAARILVSANNWTPDKRKRFSPYRSIDSWIAKQVSSQNRYSDLFSEAWEEEVEGWRDLYRDAIGTRENALANYPFDKVWERKESLSNNAVDSVWRQQLITDMQLIRREFDAMSFSPTDQGIRSLLKKNQAMALILANAYRRYARTAGFGKKT